MQQSVVRYGEAQRNKYKCYALTCIALLLEHVTAKERDVTRGLLWCQAFMIDLGN